MVVRMVRGFYNEQNNTVILMILVVILREICLMFMLILSMNPFTILMLGGLQYDDI